MKIVVGNLLVLVLIFVLLNRILDDCNWFSRSSSWCLTIH
jgi:hypothetical protein